MIFGMLSIIAIVYFFVTLFSYTYSYVSLRGEEEKLKAELLNLQDEKADLKIEIKKLNNPEYVARYAKEKYLYSADGEYIIKIETKNEQGQIIDNINNNSNVYIYIVIGLIIAVILIFIIRRKITKKGIRTKE